ncbi:MAG: SDR family NAD(P)-dependent oxidoreductase, partial [Spirochaetota bacterium]
PEQLHILSLDVTNEQSVLRAARMIGETSDSLNLLVNNAGDARERSQTISDPMYFDDMLRLYDINALGALRVCHSVMSLLLNAATKTLVNVSSLAASIGTVTRTNQYGYTMSKAALNMQSKLIHNHHKQSGLRVLAVHPGWMRTNIFGDISRMKDAPFEPIQAAENIVKLVESPPNADDAIFCDAQGHPMSW